LNAISEEVITLAIVKLKVFQFRLILNCFSKKNFFKHKLCIYPPAIYMTHQVDKAYRQLSALGNALLNVLAGDAQFLLDGGSLLKYHRHNNLGCVLERIACNVYHSDTDLMTVQKVVAIVVRELILHVFVSFETVFLCYYVCLESLNIFF